MEAEPAAPPAAPSLGVASDLTTAVNGIIIAIIIVAWMTKIFMHASPPIVSWSAFYNALAVGGLPGWFVGAVLVLTTVATTALTWYVSINSAGEVTELRGSHKEQWRI